MKKLLILFMFLSCIVYAQKDSVVTKNDSTLKEVCIYSVRSTENLPVTEKTFLTYQLLKNYQGGDIGFFLSKRNPSVFIQSDGGNYNGYQYFRIRGIDQTRINQTLNGVPMNEPEDQGAYYSNFPDFTKNISSLQVQRGVGVSSNGMASYGGSLNFESFDLKSKESVDINLGYGSWYSKRFSIGVNSKIGKNFYFYTRYSNVSSDGYRKNSGTTGQTLFYSGGFFLKKDIIKITGFFGGSNNQMAYLASSEDSIKKDRRDNPLSPNETDSFIQNHIQLQWTHSIDENTKMINTVFYNYLKGNYGVFIPSNLYNFKLNSDFYGVITNIQYSKNNITLNIGQMGNNYFRTHQMSIIPDNSKNIYSNMGQKWEYSLYLKFNIKIGKLTPYIDLQFRNVNFIYSSDNNTLTYNPVTWNFFNPKLGLSYNLNENINLYGFVGYSNREPTRTDMFGGADDIDSTNYDDVKNFNIVKPEEVFNTEIGTNIVYEKLSLKLNFFDMEFRNQILPIGKLSYIGLPLRKNVSSSYSRGIELDINYQLFKMLKLWGNFTYMSSKIKEYTDDNTNTTYYNTTPLLTPNTILNLGTDIDIVRILKISLDMRYMSSSYLDNTNGLMLPEYTLFNAATTIILPEKFQIIMNINNIFGVDYYSSGYTIANTPYYFVGSNRNFYITINKQF